LKLVVVSGLSGAGKSVAMDALEDTGFYCVDNLPVRLLGAFATELDAAPHPAYRRSAVAIDARNPAEALQELPGILKDLRDRGVVEEVIFLEARDENLIRRYSETRRKHPLTAGDVSLAEAIRRERALLDPVRASADVVIDTSRTHLHQLRDLIRQRFEQGPRRRLSLIFQSFGYKHGVPPDADMVFDARCLPNPHWVPRLRALDGRDPAVAEFLGSEPEVNALYESIAGFLDAWIPRFEAENRSYLTVAIGCTGGQHRSVYLVERLAARYRERGAVLVRHREVRERPPATAPGEG
jgi:RNase adapter protein RapZ